MSWVEVPDGVKMPETTTYKRAVKRQRAKFDSYWKANHTERTSQQKFNDAMSDYDRETKPLTRVNRFRSKRGLKPLAMPKRPKKASFGLKGGKKPSTGKSSG